MDKKCFKEIKKGLTETEQILKQHEEYSRKHSYRQMASNLKDWKNALFGSDTSYMPTGTGKKASLNFTLGGKKSRKVNKKNIRKTRRKSKKMLKKGGGLFSGLKKRSRK
jgi:hypothetical protein